MRKNKTYLSNILEVMESSGSVDDIKFLEALKSDYNNATILEKNLLRKKLKFDPSEMKSLDQILEQFSDIEKLNKLRINGKTEDLKALGWIIDTLISKAMKKLSSQ